MQQTENNMEKQVINEAPIDDAVESLDSQEIVADINDYQQLKSIIDAALAVSDEPLTIQKMQSMFHEHARPEREVIEEVLALLSADCEARGVELKRIANAYRYQSKEAYAPWIRRLFQQKTPRYSRAVLETLAIIAYRQPVTRSDIEEIRGVSVSTEIIKTLLNREWIKEVGKKEVPGRPSLYGSTAEFLGYFNLQKLSDLPPLSQMRAFEDIAKEHQFDFSLEAETLQSKADQSEPQAAQINSTGSEKDSVNEDQPKAVQTVTDQSDGAGDDETSENTDDDVIDDAYLSQERIYESDRADEDESDPENDDAEQASNQPSAKPE